MGQILVFPAASTHRRHGANGLATAGKALLAVWQRRIEAYRGASPPRPAHESHAAFAAASHIANVAGAARHIVSALRTGRTLAEASERFSEAGLARKVLRTALLSAEGAAPAIGSLEGLTELFVRARILLVRKSVDRLETRGAVWQATR